MENVRQHLTNSFILIVLALIIRVAIIALHGFDGLYGQDAFAYFDFSQDLLAFVKVRNPPPPFGWSIGYPLILAGTFFATGVSEHIALTINVVIGVLIPVLTYIIALQIKLRPTYAFFAGLLMAFSGQALQSSLVIMSDIPALFMALLSLIGLLWSTESGNRLGLIASAFFLSFAVNIRLIYLVLVPLYLLVFLMTVKSKWRLFDLLLGIPFVLLPQIPQFIYSRYNPANLLDHAWVAHWSPSNIVSSSFINVDGTFHYDTINAVFYAYPAFDVRYLSPLFVLFLAVGVISLLRSRLWYKIILLLGWLILPYLFLSGIPYQNIRFALILLPIIVVLVASGLQSIARIQHRAKWLLLLLGLVGLLHTAVSGSDYANTFVAYHQSEKEVVDWVTDKVPEDATLYTFGSTLTLQHYTDLNIIELYYETPSTLNQRWFRGRADYVLVNVWQIENQWQGREPQANYHWFRDERGLTEIGQFHNLTLFKANE